MGWTDEQLVPFSSFESRSRSLGAKKMNLLRRGGAKKQSIGGCEGCHGSIGRLVGRSPLSTIWMIVTYFAPANLEHKEIKKYFLQVVSWLLS